MYRLMIIDDEYMIHLSLRKLVETSGLDIIVTGEAEDGEEALELLDSSSPHIVVTDIRMPRMDGLAFIEAAQQRRNGMRFIILSGYDHFEYAQQAIRFGVSNFLLKPVDPDQFLESLSIVYEQLKKDEDRLIRQGDWFVKYQELAKELASAIWSTDQTEALAILSRACLHYEERGTEELAFAKFASGLLEWVEQNLNDRFFTLSRSWRDVPNWPARKDLGMAYLESAVASMISEIKGSRNLGARHNMLKATEFIKEHYADEELSLSRVAAELGMSAAYLSRSFKEEMNINFVKYLVQTRLEKAAELLKQGDSPAADIAYRVGFTDYSHFSRTFKKHFGLTPAEYRKSGSRHA